MVKRKGNTKVRMAPHLDRHHANPAFRGPRHPPERCSEAKAEKAELVRGVMEMSARDDRVESVVTPMIIGSRGAWWDSDWLSQVKPAPEGRSHVYWRDLPGQREQGNGAEREHGETRAAQIV